MSYLEDAMAASLQQMGAPVPGPDGPRHVYSYDFKDLDALADHVQKIGGPFREEGYGESLIRLCREGWRAHEAEAMEVCDAATRMVDANVEQFLPVFDVAGGSVEMGRYMSGEPECMVDFPLQQVSTVGSVVTMIADVQCSAMVSNQSVMKRGFTIAGLAMALDRLGHSTDLWVSDEYWCGERPDERIIIRTHVKGPEDFIDPASILFAYAHPGMQRGLGFQIARKTEGYDGRYGAALMGANLGPPTATTKNMPENTIYIPPLMRASDAPNADVEIRRYLVQLGLLPEVEDE